MNHGHFFEIKENMDFLLRQAVDQIDSNLIESGLTRKIQALSGLITGVDPPEKIKIRLLERLHPDV